MSKKRLVSYSKLHLAYPEVYEPQTIEQLKQIISKLNIEQQRFIFRGAGYSFDAQAIGDNIVISLNKLNRIKLVDQYNAQITVESGVRWRDIIQTLYPLGLTPYIVVTSGEITAGGTLSANCFSRNSPRYGKEGNHIARFQLLTLNGDIFECSPNKNQELFFAVIGGFGYLGVVTEITYNLLSIEPDSQVKTIINKYNNLESFVENLIQYTHNSKNWDAVYSLVISSKSGYKGIICRSKYQSNITGKSLPIYQDNNWLSIPLGWLMSYRFFNNLILDMAFKYIIREDEIYVNNFESYTFFMDNHRKLKEIADFIGDKSYTIQQTYVIPSINLLYFLQIMTQALQNSALSANMFDILFLPADKFIMSSNREMDGFAVSVAFEKVQQRNLSRLCIELKNLSEVCCKLRGRVHLIKNVYITKEQLQIMYGSSINNFIDLKSRVDPNNLLRNNFFERIFS